MGIHKVEVVCRCWKRWVVERVDWVDFYWLVSFDLVVGVGGPLCRKVSCFVRLGFFCADISGLEASVQVDWRILCLRFLLPSSHRTRLYSSTVHT
jgi:hypothetical protein